jgi:hypothetical protein
MTVGTQDPAQGLNDDMLGLLRQFGELIVRGQARADARFDRLEGDVAELKTGVAELKTDVAELKTGLAQTNERLDRSELANERRANRVDAQFERLFALIQRDEYKRH